MDLNAFWTTTAVRIEDDAQEREIIARAQSGDGDATMRLANAYLGVLKGAVNKHRNVCNPDDARQAAFEGLLAAIQAYDPDKGSRLGAVIRQHVQAALAATAAESHEGFAVPDRTLKRFFGILARADGDPIKAAELAPEFNMTADTFYGVLQAVRATGSLEAHMADGGDDLVSKIGPVIAADEYADVETRELVEMAFAAVDDTEAEVCERAYGFDPHYNPQGHDEIAEAMGFSRATARRTRDRALTKMRSAVGA